LHYFCADCAHYIVDTYICRTRIDVLYMRTLNESLKTRSNTYKKVEIRTNPT